MKPLGFFLSLLLISSLSFAQSIWPGDVSNNGQVNGVDYLYWGHAAQATGPERPEASSEWTEQTLGMPWAQTFPFNLNFAYADANGDGRVNANDAEVINAYFKRTHGVVETDSLIPIVNDISGTGLLEVSPIPLQQGINLAEMTFTVDLRINRAVQNLYGFTFALKFPAELLRASNGILYNITSSSFLFPAASNIRSFIHHDQGTDTFYVTVVKTDQVGMNGEGSIGQLILRLRPDLRIRDVNFPVIMSFSDETFVNDDLHRFAAAVRSLTITRNDFTVGGCPNIVDPVCGSDGRTYINSCYAEAAGVMDYTSGSCFDNSCIDPQQIDSNASCSTIFDPVCGCNGITYTNACAADAAGVISTTPGPCATSNNCYDPLYVVTSNSTTVDANTGVITVNCTTNFDPVCGCNGVTYTNACLAEASGIRVYTAGTCESSCIDPADIDPNATCTTEYDPVCGCNGVTYMNPCRAEAAGLQNYTPGTCSGTSAWCDEAIPLQCGDFLSNETTVGAGNNIVQYPGCTSNTFFGADRVYVIEKTTIGDLQIGLEITTPGLDLDLFLLGDNCSQVSCLAKSTTDNSQTNNEGIIYEDAPLGTYYIIVDGQHASSEGNFRLEVSCGYLFCGNAVPIQCGQTYNGTNLNGNDDVSLYTCGNTLNVENNGPEIVHTFTTTQAGPVNISLSGLSANLELFLLDACDRGACLKYSQNPGNSSEFITDFLPAGTYYVVVDGYNGAVSNYSLNIDCTSSCDMAIVDLSTTSSSCGQSSGSITISTSGGTPNYLVTYNGPRNGSFTTSANTCSINFLPPGVYTITKTDALGCTVSGEITVIGGGNLSVNLTPQDAVCMTGGRLRVFISNGQAPYAVRLTGPSSGVSTVGVNDFTINDLDPGNYTLFITDAFGCSLTQQFVIGQSSGDFIWNHSVTPASCGGYGAIHIDTYNGIPPYNVVVRGPVNGGATVNVSSFNVINLPGGTYQVTVEDGNWCQSTRTIVVPTENVSVGLSETAGICGQEGSIAVFISDGSPGYQISWSGPESGSTNTNNDQFVIADLQAGTYTIQVRDNNGCTDTETVTLSAPENGGLDANIIPLDGACNQNGALWIDIYNGVPPFTISYTGPESGTTVVTEANFDVGNLPCGVYNVTITDVSGCDYTQSTTINGCGDINVGVTPENGICGQEGSILVNITGGSPIYSVSWSGPESGQTTTTTNSVNLSNLSAGTYSISVTGSAGCTDNATAQLTNSESNLLLQTSVTEATCGSEGSIGLNILGGVGPYQVSWTGPESGVFNTNSPINTISNLSAGTYQLYVVDGNGCSESEAITIENLGSDLNVSLVGNDGICINFGNIGVNVFNGQAPYTVNYTGPITGVYTTNSSVSQITNTPAGTYVVVVTDANGCSTSGTVQINVQNNLNASLTPVNGQCDSPGSINVVISQGQPGYSISWTNGSNVNGTVNINNNNYTITDLPSGNYSVVITDQAGCSRTLTTTIDNGNGNISITTALIYNICGQHNTIWVDVMGGTPPYSVTWVETGTGVTTGSGTYPTGAFEIPDLPPGTYKVTVVDANGCMTMQPDIIIYPSPVDIITITPFNGVCGEDGYVQVDISGGTGPYTLTWNGPTSGTQTYQGGTNIITNLSSGDYTFTLVDANNCTEVETVTLTNGGSPLEIVTALIYNDCGQYNTIWVDVIGGTPPFTVTWIETGGGLNTGTETYPTGAFEIFDLPPGTYKVTVVDANGCMDMNTDIIIYPSPINIFTATGQDGVCGENGKIDINVTGGTGPYTLTYSGPVSGTQPVPFGLSVLTGFPSGTYTLTLTDANGCTEVETVIINNTQGIPLTIDAALIFNDCGQYNTIWIDVTGGTPPYTVTWTGGQNGSATYPTGAFEIFDLPPGTYKVTVTDVNGCMDMQQDIVIYPAPVDIFNVTTTSGDCGAPGTITLNMTAGTAPYTLQYTGPISGTTTIAGTSFTLDPAPAGNYTLTLTDDNGCTEVEQVVVSTTEGGLDLTATGENGNCTVSPSITAQAAGGAGSYTLTWSGPESGSANIGNAPFTINDLTPGTYILTANDGSGCNDTEEVTVAQTEDDLSISLTPTSGDCGAAGQIGVRITGGSPNYQISWAGPSSGTVNIGGTFVIIPNLASGTYTISVTDGGGCSTQEVTTLQNNNSTVGVIATAQTGQCGTSGSINLVLSGGNGTYQVNWTGPTSGSQTVAGNTAQLTGLLPGAYQVTASSAGCSNNTSALLGAGTPALNISTAVTNASCSVGGSIVVSLSGNQGNVILTWNGPVSGSTTMTGAPFTITDLTPGTYTLAATDTNSSCTDTEQVTIGQAENDLSISLTPTPGDCGATGQIGVSITSGTPTYQISWSGPASGNININGTFANIPNLPSGTYTINVTDSNGCSDQQVTTLQNGNTNIGITATAQAGQCGTSGSINLVLSGGNGTYQVSWTGPTSGSQTVTGNTTQFTGLLPGTYQVTASSAGCSNNTSVLLGPGTPALTISTAVTNASCSIGGSIVVSLSGNQGNVILTWNGPVSGSTTMTGAPFTITDLTAGTYTLTATDSSSSCTDTEQVTIGQAENDLSISLTPTPGNCGAAGQIGVSITGGAPDYQISWSGPSSGTVNISGNFVNIPNLTSGTYTINVSDSGGCSDQQVTTLQNGNTNIGITATAQAGQCGASGSINLALSGGNGTYQISWTGPTNGTRTVTGNTAQLNGLSPGTYQITASSAGCSSNTSVLLGIGSPALEISTSTTDADCGTTGSIAVSLSGTQGSTTLSWSGPESGSVVIQGASHVINNLTVGTYTISATSGICSDVETATVSSSGSNLNVTASPVAGVCGNDGSIVLQITGGSAPYNIQWTGAESGNLTSNSTTVTLSNLSAGGYNIQVNSGGGACSANTSATVATSENDLTITAFPQAGSCLANPAILVELSGGAAPYLLSWAGPISGNTTINNNSYRIPDLVAGYYSLSVVDANGCQRSTSVVLTDGDLDISLSAQDGTCGDNTVITVDITNGTGPYTINWYGEIDGYAVTDQTTYNIFNLPGGTYQIVVEDINGCTDSGTISVQSGATDFYVDHSVSDNGCGELNNIWMDFYNGQAPYQIEWIGPESGSITVNVDGYDIVHLPSGFYIIIVRDATGCIDVQQVEVINTPNDLDVTFTPRSGSCGSNGSIGVYATGGTPIYTVSWYRDGVPVSVRFMNGNFFNIDNLTGGNYLVIVEDEGGCERRDDFVITTDATEMMLDITTVSPGCSNDGSIGITFGGGQGPFQVQWTGAASGNASTNDPSYIINGLDGGDYNLTVTDVNGCTGTASTTVYGTTRGDIEAEFSAQVDGLTVDFINESSNGLYFWDFGDGNTLTTHDETISYTYSTPGTYQVCLRMTETCGTDLYCESVTVHSSGNLARLDIGENSGGSGTTISLPVTLENADNIISLAGSVNVVNDAVGQLVSVTPGVIAPQFNAANNTFSFFSNGGSPLYFDNDEVLFYFNVQLTGSSGERTVVEWAQWPLPIEIGTMIGDEAGILAYTTTNGEATITDVAALRGVVTTFWGEPIADTEISIIGPAYNGSVMTDEGGVYDMPDLEAGVSYDVGASRVDDHSNGLSTYGLFIGQRFLLGMEPEQIYSPYQVIAGDANCNNAFTTLDLFLIQRLIIGAADEFANCAAWKFVSDVSEMPEDFDAYNVFPYINTHPMMLMEPESADFIGVKTGDLLGDVYLEGLAPEDEMPAEERGNSTLTFRSTNPAITNGEEVTLYFTSEEFENIVSYQFGLQFPADQLEFVEFLPATTQPFQTVVAGEGGAAAGKLRLSWFSLDGEGHTAASDVPLFGLRFRALRDIDDFGAIMRIDPSEMRAEAFDDAEQHLRPTLDFNGDVTSTEDIQLADYVLYQNVPNPVNGETLIGFHLPEAAKATLTLRDALGQIVWSQTQDYLAGQQQVRIDGTQLPAGVYHYSLRANNFRATKSLVVVK